MGTSTTSFSRAICLQKQTYRHRAMPVRLFPNWSMLQWPVPPVTAAPRRTGQHGSTAHPLVAERVTRFLHVCMSLALYRYPVADVPGAVWVLRTVGTAVSL